MLHEFLLGFGTLVLYYLVVAVLILFAKAWLKPPDELTRKLLHFVCFMSVFVLLYAFDTWYLAVISAIVFSLLIYPALAILESNTKLMEHLIQRRKGEVKTSLLLVFCMMAVLITIFWGLLGEEWKFIVIVATMAWGFGDAAAALIGKSYGKHQVKSRFVEGAKTIEGSLAMCLVSLLVMFITLFVYAPVSWDLCIVIAFLVAPLCALTELFSHRGTDTVNVPFATALSIFTLMYFFIN